MINFLDVREDAPELVDVKSDFYDLHGRPYKIQIDQKAPIVQLFDIDGTLLNAKSIHARALGALYMKRFPELPWNSEGFRQKFEQDWFVGWGPGDRQEHRILCEKYRLLPTDSKTRDLVIDQLVHGYGELMDIILMSLSDEEKNKLVLPGVRNFLEQNKALGIPAIIVTGNVRKSAEAFLKYLDLGKYFLTGGFDDDPGVTDQPYRRTNILRAAIEKLKNKGITYPHNQMTVWGDTPKDYLATTHLPDQNQRPYTFLLASGDHSIEQLGKVRDQKDRQAHLITNGINNIRSDVYYRSLYATKE